MVCCLHKDTFPDLVSPVCEIHITNHESREFTLSTWNPCEASWMRTGKNRQPSPGVHNHSLCSFMRAKGVDIYEIMRHTILQSVFHSPVLTLLVFKYEWAWLCFSLVKPLGLSCCVWALTGLAWKELPCLHWCRHLIYASPLRTWRDVENELSSSLLLSCSSS